MVMRSLMAMSSAQFVNNYHSAHVDSVGLYSFDTRNKTIAANQWRLMNGSLLLSDNEESA